MINRNQCRTSNWFSGFVIGVCVLASAMTQGCTVEIVAIPPPQGSSNGSTGGSTTTSGTATNDNANGSGAANGSGSANENGNSNGSVANENNTSGTNSNANGNGNGNIVDTGNGNTATPIKPAACTIIDASAFTADNVIAGYASPPAGSNEVFNIVSVTFMDKATDTPGVGYQITPLTTPITIQLASALPSNLTSDQASSADAGADPNQFYVGPHNFVFTLDRVNSAAASQNIDVTASERVGCRVEVNAQDTVANANAAVTPSNAEALRDSAGN